MEEDLTVICPVTAPSKFDDRSLDLISDYKQPAPLPLLLIKVDYACVSHWSCLTLNRH